MKMNTALCKDKIWNFLGQKNTVIGLYLGLALVASVTKYLAGSYNNYLIFKYVFWHTWEQSPAGLYAPDSAYFDTNHYGSFFSLIIAPFALLPDWLGMMLWNLANVSVLLAGIFSLPISEYGKKMIAWICAHESLTALLSFQFNIAITGLILLSFSYVERQQAAKAAVAIVVGFLVKLYGIVGLAFFFFSKKKLRFSLWMLGILVAFTCLPMLISSPAFIKQSYIDWFHSLVYKNFDNQTNNIGADLSLLGFLKRTVGLQINVLYGVAFGGLLLLIALLRRQAYGFLKYRLLILSYVLFCIVLFNTNVESPTYAIGFFGVGIWFFTVKRSPYTLALLVFALILTSFSPSDLFPKFIRDQYVTPYALKALPCICIWADVVYRLFATSLSELRLKMD